MKLTFFLRFAAEPARPPPPVRPQAEAAGVRENLTMVASTLLLSDLGRDCQEAQFPAHTFPVKAGMLPKSSVTAHPRGATCKTQP